MKRAVVQDRDPLFHGLLVQVASDRCASFGRSYFLAASSVASMASRPSGR